MLDHTMPLQTRHGYPARLVATNLRHEYGPLVFAITYPDGIERLGFRRENGAYPMDGGDQWDIVYAVPREVVITIESGLADVRTLPSDVKVKIIDFDVEGIDPDDLSTDNGRPCIIHEYGPGDQP